MPYVDVKVYNTSAQEVGPIRIDTSPPFSVIGDTAVPMTCPAIVDYAKKNQISNLLAVYGLDPTKKNPPSLVAEASDYSSLKYFIGQAGPGTSIDQNRDISTLEGHTDLTNYLNELRNKYLPVIRLVNTCLAENLQFDTSAWKAANDAVAESQSRLDSIRNPETHISYYEGWFPITRPMKEVTLFGLFGTAIFILLISCLLLLRMRGVYLELHLPEIMLPSFSLPPEAYSYIGGGVAVGIVGALLYNYFTK